MKIETIIHSNGSKWGGESPDSIQKLIDVLGNNTIEERFFKSFFKVDKTGKVWYQCCPIDKSVNGNKMIFFGNFEEISHVFRIETNDPDIISKLSQAIRANKGWELYRERNLIKNAINN